jgi:hypothetical protein
MIRPPLNIFYEEPDVDRWLPFDRYPRRVLRRLVRGKPQPAGQMRVFLNLCAGLDRLGVRYRVNDYRYIKRQPQELACIVGKPVVLDKLRWLNPILFGASVYSHPLEDPTLLSRLPVRKILVPGEWMRQMWEPYFGAAVQVWPVGIDTHLWRPRPEIPKPFDVMLYDKVRWDHEAYETSLLAPIRAALEQRGLRVVELRYGYYREEHFHMLLQQCRAMVFLCEHETQGIAYQQALASGIPLFAWDRGGFWQDPSFYPDKVRYAPVSSVPYWDERCGMKFEHAQSFASQLGTFWAMVEEDRFSPREYILENLTLEHCSQRYLDIVDATCAEERATVRSGHFRAFTAESLPS